MNRQTNRLPQHEGQLARDSAPAPRPAPSGPPARRAPDSSRPGPAAWAAQYFREVRQELGKVLWPGRSEVINYSVVVFVTLVLISLLIFALNYLFARGVFLLY